MRNPISRKSSPKAKLADSPDAPLAMHGTDFLLSMVEARWAGKNGDGKQMDSGSKTEKEIQKIEEQVARLESVAGQNDDTRTQIRQLNERIQALRDQVASRTGAWEKTELA